jgi:glycosyltransferase involved in cell wall biosynthesis
MSLPVPRTEGDDPYAFTRQAILLRQALARHLKATGSDPFTRQNNPRYEPAHLPAVSVVVSLYNYAEYVEECLRSVEVSARQISEGVEIVVVDDDSSDASAAVASRVLADMELPACLLRKTFNTGVCDARNLGVELSRGEHVFILDADNLLLPKCLATLRAALLSSGAALAYGISARFDARTGRGVGLNSQFAWDPMELARSPYIDAMALFTRSALLAHGGYASEMVQYGWYGWDDYDLYLTLAGAGLRGEFVPQILCRYRDHARSMVRTTNRFVEGIASYLEAKHGWMADQYDHLEKRFFLPCRFEGAFDGVVDGKLVGWAADRNRFDRRIRVFLYDGVTALGKTVADELRWDLREAGVGDGCYGFSIPLPSALNDGKSHWVHLQFEGTRKNLSGTPFLYPVAYPAAPTVTATTAPERGLGKKVRSAFARAKRLGSGEQGMTRF